MRQRVAELTDRPVEVVGVTKGFDAELIARVGAAGIATVGENYAQEVVAKADAIAAAGVDVAFIGQLQTNKVRALAPIVTRWATVDRTRLAVEIATRAPGATVMIQVDPLGGSAAGKGGCAVADVDDLVAECRRHSLNLDGMMTVGPTSGDPAATAEAFRTTRRLADEHGLAECSMGMSGDWELAVELGSTQLRLGTVLFGTRPSALRNRP